MKVVVAIEALDATPAGCYTEMHSADLMATPSLFGGLQIHANICMRTVLMTETSAKLLGH